MIRCPRCRRANPDEAGFCHFDGIALRGQPHAIPGGGGSSEGIFRRPWAFPGGKPCSTVDEFAAGCMADWSAARQCLIRREFQPYFVEIGRPDLAAVVPEAAPDSELALQAFLEQLPVTRPIRPSLDVAPRRVLMSGGSDGEIRTAVVRILNRGQGLLHGTCERVSGAGGLELSATAFRTRDEALLELRWDTARLPGSGSYLAKVRIVSNGGSIELPVQIDAGSSAVPFQGRPIADRRDLAKLMLEQPKRAAEWLADGSVERYFRSRRWEFSLEPPHPPGLAGVQRFYEAFGFSKVPRITVDETDMDVLCEYPESVTRTVVLTADRKKWIYAWMESSSRWLKPKCSPDGAPGRLEMEFEVDSGMLEAGRRHEGILTVRYNGGGESTVIVRVDVRRGYEPWTRKILKPFLG